LNILSGTKELITLSELSFLALLGCSWPDFVRYLERRFKPGMSWENFGEWTIDHTFPIRAFNLKRHEDRAMVCHFTNLAPMWADENRRKNRSFSKAELSLYKTQWRLTYAPKSKRLTFADQPNADLCPF
jgi:hypothetical protein